LAKAILHALDSEVDDAELVDDGYVEFEFIGTRPYLKERAFTRGANCTSIDAFMIGRTKAGKRRAFLVEWKYIEECTRNDEYTLPRAAVYNNLITSQESPFKSAIPIVLGPLYVGPFYQLMRQTLLGWQISKNEDHGCTSYRHVLVVPEHNMEFRVNVTARLPGASVPEAWLQVLKEPELFITTTPGDIVRPADKVQDTKALTVYLQRRYWSGDVGPPNPIA
jgi:hypothetical protein